MADDEPSFESTSVAAVLAQRSREDRRELLATYAARELALERTQAEAVQRRGSGVVGARVEESNWGWGANAIEFFAVGTAVTRMDGAAEPLPLSDVQHIVTFDNAG